MRYTGDEYSPMYRIMIHDEYGMTMRDLIRECMLVIGPNMMDLPWRYWTVLGPAPFHTLPLILSSFRCRGPPLTAVARERYERTMRRRFYLSMFPPIFSPILNENSIILNRIFTYVPSSIFYYFVSFFLRILCIFTNVYIVTSVDFL